jgi:GINS complex subunit 4
MRRAVDKQQEDIDELGPNESIVRMVYETEVDRVCFLLRSYLRTRIIKIQAQALFLARDEEAQGRLSEPEAIFAAQYAALYQRHVDREAWALGRASRLPDTLKQLANVSQLATPPNFEAHVFCVATRDCPPFAINGTAGTIELLRGQVTLLPYAPLRPLIEDGFVGLA